MTVEFAAPESVVGAVGQWVYLEPVAVSSLEHVAAGFKVQRIPKSRICVPHAQEYQGVIVPTQHGIEKCAMAFV